MDDRSRMREEARGRAPRVEVSRAAREPAPLEDDDRDEFGRSRCARAGRHGRSLLTVIEKVGHHTTTQRRCEASSLLVPAPVVGLCSAESRATVQQRGLRRGVSIDTYLSTCSSLGLSLTVSLTTFAREANTIYIAGSRPTGRIALLMAVAQRLPEGRTSLSTPTRMKMRPRTLSSQG